jgi:hypothetical protein
MTIEKFIQRVCEMPDTFTSTLMRLTESDVNELSSDDLVDAVSLRVFSDASLVSYLTDISSPAESTLEIEFNELPEAVLPNVLKLFGVKDAEIYKYRKDGRWKHAFKFNVKDSDFDDKERR